MDRLIGWAPAIKDVGCHCGWDRLDCGQEKLWMVWKPRDGDQAKIGLANGQPGSDTKAVGAGFREHNIPEINP